ncbi:biotin--[acetyl-CoA-carboxylase] ligase [Chlorobaculum thiosulfatiphilum]|uniref:Bifunctional ligase/repressor BirA n=1 Tax=Chlorobaculum thiosulfatiphilum TaxID=115852 RepID=A0A5C4S9A0_CHLTI|nr:biotin--[acetyl-CoA-carboxylase] ligase [Chlorobaculum thiosulfatiphilum]TNJ39549.1 biotin--[acetyl-CoA-carboxylase] ligase [Chlorobaculum thiosulfatiphilum]
MNPLAATILQRLAADGGFVSGGQLCGELRISRSAVWKHVAALRKSGYAIEAVSGRGYRLERLTGDPVQEEVVPLLDTASFGRNFIYLASTDSTNLRARALARDGAPEGAVVVADSQTGGRGRMRRAWVSPAGVNLYCSIVLRPPVPSVRVPEIPLVAAAAIHGAISEECVGLSAFIKWPNDIIVAGRKLCGILCEMESEPDCTHFVVVGFGLNVNLDPVPEELQSIATSIAIETGARVSRARLLAAVLNRFERLYFEWLGRDDLSFILPCLEAYAWLKGHELKIEQFNRVLTGTEVGLSPQGHLLLRTADGAILPVSSGEAHLLPVNHETRPA